MKVRSDAWVEEGSLLAFSLSFKILVLVWIPRHTLKVEW